MRWNNSGALYGLFAALLLPACLLLLAGANAERQLAPAVSPGPQSTQPSAPATEDHSQHEFFVMIDPAHGGEDRGARLNEKLFEKDVTLALARRLKLELQERGIAARMLRDADTSLGLEERAELTNEQHASLYVAIHAGTPGKGARIYSSARVSSASRASGKFLLWDNAQDNYLSHSQALAKGIAGALAKKDVSAASLSTPLRPLNNIKATAIAVELAAGSDDVQQVMGQKFQAAVATAVAAEITQQRSQWEKQP